MQEVRDNRSQDGLVLVVDDDVQVLRSLKRVLRRHGFRVETCEAGSDALEVLEREPVAVLISDQRMPQMCGSELLAKSFDRYPDTYRVTITGYTDLEAAKESINQGHVHQFLTKPWDDQHLISVVRDGVAAYEILHENRRLQQLVASQNEKLKALNAGLEATVAERTRQLSEQNADLRKLESSLRRSLRETVVVLAATVGSYDPSRGVRSSRIAHTAELVARCLGLPRDVVRDVVFAAYLSDLGILSRTQQRFDPQDGRRRPPAPGPKSTVAELGATLLGRVHGFEVTAAAIRHRDERMDGKGRPEALVGDQIPIGSRILAVCTAFDDALYASGQPTSRDMGEAMRTLERGLHQRFDPSVVEALRSIVEGSESPAMAGNEIELAPRRLRRGMVLTRDLMSVHGLLLLKAGTELTREMVAHMQHFADEHLLPTGVHVDGSIRQPTSAAGEPEATEECADGAT